MRISWLIGALVCFVMGVVFSMSLVGMFIGIPLIVLSLILLFVGIILPGQNKEIHIYHKK